MRRLVLASGNAHKLVELRAMFAAAGLPFTLHAARELGPAPTIAEDQDSFVAHAALKARGIAAWLRGRGEAGETLVLADDSGVCVDALGGAPGVDSAVFAGPQADDAANNAALLAALAERGLTRSPAHYVCVLALRRVDGEPMQLHGSDAHAVGPDLTLFTARWHGEIRCERAGAAGFGYDPYFWIPACAGAQGPTTAAALTPAEKNACSHRGLAVRALIAGLAVMA
ncbi:non-canonical purine NTP pyrophosphatase [Nannocystis sp.]|uniref:non-canonical purine NTP pyrophosphatase n=1 Tax=Nannocystis sp. TaxID=1962667 RepID=UPI0025CBF862|nr:non-canonical purine NTP pyrophosphatase [Nannocystis sp.]MBK7823824.1 non-canonical purine NTP pyrophosphatase [Nannocystis sp.]